MEFITATEARLEQAALAKAPRLCAQAMRLFSLVLQDGALMISSMVASVRVSPTVQRASFFTLSSCGLLSAARTWRATQQVPWCVLIRKDTNSIGLVPHPIKLIHLI